MEKIDVERVLIKEQTPTPVSTEKIREELEKHQNTKPLANVNVRRGSQDKGDWVYHPSPNTNNAFQDAFSKHM
ncbi:hypothetical protein AKO1_015746 [Acrasis kona]|uniref:Uncharacterized protein n=1 Tax=Acrasis kona TaxID=1008807 RepID=A0AAW2Z0L5_9EUKA